jgi:outer membrane immunogenic protein
MKLLSSILGLTLSSVAAIASANAADLYAPVAGPGGYKDGPYVPAPIWSGFYAGISGGYAWGNDSSLTAGVTVPEIFNEVDPRFSTSGGFGGGQLGYNWQRDRIVFGIEADIQGADVTGSGTETVSENGGSGTASARNSLDWFGTVRGRLGYTFDRALIYATGGLAFGGVNDKLAVTAAYGVNSATQTFQNDLTKTGYVIGGGVEYALSPAFSVKAEYQYIDLGGDKLSGSSVLPGNPTVTATGETNFAHAYDTVRLGLNYHILPGYEPLK